MLVSDASTLILLAKVTILEKALEHLGKVSISKEVFNESVHKKELFDAQIIIRQVKNKSIVVKSVSKEKFKEILSQFKLGEGEAATYALYTEGKYTALLTDDRELIKLCKVERIPFITAMSLIVRLYEKKKLQKEEALEKLDALCRIGRYSKEVYEIFKEELK